ncbi:hypothetical protein KC19_VG246700 [Ceratodon purpureus]|uniref:Uncharacterized protein n=1 Tax=Ceratodon purpureus TaxID=3225 RepID=A0A8T0HUU1_CERPU|nr:hypothetical protein KC19_VG246700 [Ceratodon purpureus]
MSVVNQFMAKFVDLTQIYYKDNDDRFVLVENLVRDEFDFEPPLKPGWFPDYMRKKMEKSRFLLRKHYKETGQMHHECFANKYSALLSWRLSLEGSNKSQRMREMNTAKKKKRL